MLHPKFFARPFSWPDNQPYSITGYTKARSGHVLVQWASEDDGERITGETLFNPQGDELASAGGELDIDPGYPTNAPVVNPKTALSAAIGRYVPPAIAQQLRNISMPGVVHVKFQSPSSPSS